MSTFYGLSRLPATRMCRFAQFHFPSALGARRLFVAGTATGRLPRLDRSAKFSSRSPSNISTAIMRLDGATFAASVTELHGHTVEAWHHSELNNPYQGLLAIVCRQHQFNFLLWHEEDIARCPDASDRQIAEVKRAIDRYNQQRNDWIEKLDEALAEQLRPTGTSPDPGAKPNSETPGSVIDRLSILALRLYHYREQFDREDAAPAHRQRVAERLEICTAQQADLSASLAVLVDDIRSGRKVLKLYRQLKMYNDPTLNPYLYARRKAG